MFEKDLKDQKTSLQECSLVYHHQVSFLLNSANTTDKEEFIGLFNMINSLYHSWGIQKIARVETSIKVIRKGIERNRYTIPVNPYFDLDKERMNQILHYMKAPLKLIEVINARHSENIHIGVGIDQDNNMKKVYFPNPDKSISAYGYENNLDFGSKIYRLVSEDNYNDEVTRLKNIINSPQIVQLLFSIIPSQDWYIVYRRFDVKGDQQEHCGYHICPNKKTIIKDIKSSLCDLIEYTFPNIAKEEFMSWLENVGDAYFFWLGIGRDKDHELEFSIYIRNTDF